MFAIVMAGGSGTRLWPLSRRETPKQLLPLTGDTSLLQQTVARLGALLQPHDIYVITSQDHVRPTQRQLPQLPEDNVLGEPLARSTAVAAGLATILARRQSDEVAFVLPADHFVADEAAFAEGLREAARTAERGYLVTLGVQPTHPATGYGYIKAGKRLHPSTPTALVDRFVEKPDAKRAASFLKEGDHYWNSGIFVWRVYAFRQAVERFQPELGSALERIEAIHRTPGWMTEVRTILEHVPAITIDVGIAEPAAAEGRMAVVPLNAGWSEEPAAGIRKRSVRTREFRQGSDTYELDEQIKNDDDRYCSKQSKRHLPAWILRFAGADGRHFKAAEGKHQQ